MVAPDLTVLSPRTFVKNDRGGMRLIGTVLKPVSPGFTLANGVSGIR